MNIYIYGSKSFKQEIHKTLDHANINLKLGSGYIEDVDSLELLKESIKSSPDDIYLIDNSKIVDKESFINSKIKFLAPKDGIEKEFLQEHGIGDISVDSMDDLAKHISKKIAEVEDNDDYDIIDDQIIEELTADDTKIVDDSRKEDLIDDELSDLLEYDEESENDDDDNDLDNNKISSFKEEDDFSLDNVDLPLDLLSFDEVDENEFDNLDKSTHNSSNSIDDELDDIMNFDGIDIQDNMIDDDEDESKEYNYDLMDDVTGNSNKQTEIINLQKKPQGVQMSNELDELGNIDENDMMAALQSLDFDAPIISQTPTKNVAKSVKQDIGSSQNISLDGINLEQISALLSQLLQNKTLDISIKIRD